MENDDVLSLDGYSWFGSNRTHVHINAPHGSGGVGLFVKECICQEFSVAVVDKCVDGILGLRFVHNVSDYTFVVFSCYLPPENSPWGRDATAFFSHLLAQTYLFADVDDLFMCGDVNARTGNLSDYVPDIDDLGTRTNIDNTINSHGRSFVEFLQESKMCLANGRVTPENDGWTSVSGRGLSVVDYIWLQHGSIENCKLFNVETCTEIINRCGLHNLLGRRCKSPDHALLTLVVCINCNLEVPADNTHVPGSVNGHTGRKYKLRTIPADFMTSELVCNALTDVIDRIVYCRETQGELDQIYDTLCNIIMHEMNEKIPYTELRQTRKRRCVNKPFWNEELQDLWNKLHKAEKIFTRCRDPVTRREKRTHYKSAQQLFDRRYRFYERKYKRSIIDQIEESCTDNPRQFWEHLKRIGPRKKSKRTQGVYAEDGETIITDNDVVHERWRGDFETLLNNLDTSQFDETFHNDIKTRVYLQEQNMNDPLYDGTVDINVDISFDEVKKVVTKSKANKSAGIDTIPYEVLKFNSVIQVLQQLFQVCFDTGKVPSLWLKAIISPIPKSGNIDPHIPLNHRGISLLSTVAKLYGSVLNNRVVTYLNTHDVLVDEQNGFRRKRSCEDHIFSLTSLVRNSLNQKQSVFAVFIDLQKAFDYVDRESLLFKLNNYGINGKLYFSIKSLYQNTLSCIRINGQHTDWFSTTLGVRQGDTLSPTLFSVYINDLVTGLNELGLGIDVNGRNVSSLVYADDIVMLTNREANLQAMLDFVSNWTKKWRVLANVEKTKVIHFRKPRVRQSTAVFKLGSDALQYVDTYKYLGVELTEHLDFSHTAEVLSKSAGRAQGAITAKYKKMDGMGVDSYKKLFDTCVTPVLHYSAGIWGFKQYTKCDQVQNKAMRIFLGVHKFAPVLALQGDIGWYPCTLLRRLDMLRMWNRLCTMPDDRLTKLIFLWDYNICRNNWSSEVSQIFDSLHMPDVFVERTECDLSNVTQRYHTLADNEWSTDLLDKPKLRNYRLFKERIECEPYVSMNLDRIDRSFLAQYRMGILPIAVETGRYKNVPLENRKCIVCNNDQIEDEEHLLEWCDAYVDLRENLHQYINNKFPGFSDLPVAEKLKCSYLNCPRQLAKYVKDAYGRRRSLLYS